MIYTPDSNDLSGKKRFIDHLEDFRKTILKIAVVISACFVICFYFSPQILHFLKLPLVKAIQASIQNHPVDKILRSLNPTGSFIMATKIAFIAGLALSFPLLFYFIASFLIPALTKQEKRYLAPVLITSCFLFICGLIFCYFIVLPLMLNFLWNFSRWMGIINDWTLEYYVGFVTQTLIMFGLAFETPVFIGGLVLLNLLSYKLLKSKRRHAIVIIFIIAAIVTPPDVMSQLLIAIPLVILYEISIWEAYFIERKQASYLAG